MLLGAAKGMLYLHSREPPIIHRDLKSPNLLVTAHWQVKVSLVHTLGSRHLVQCQVAQCASGAWSFNAMAGCEGADASAQDALHNAMPPKACTYALCSHMLLSSQKPMTQLLMQICDFNLSRVMEEISVLSSMRTTNPRWLAPEIQASKDYSLSNDVYRLESLCGSS